MPSATGPRTGTRSQEASRRRGWPGRPHTTLRGAVPDLIHVRQQWSVAPKTAKAVLAHIERRFFPETRVAAFRLANAA